jgi:hypothetical protein
MNAIRHEPAGAGPSGDSVACSEIAEAKVDSIHTSC